MEQALTAALAVSASLHHGKTNRVIASTGPGAAETYEWGSRWPTSILMELDWSLGCEQCYPFQLGVEEAEEIIYAGLAAGHGRKIRRQFDPVGQYARPEILRLVVDRDAKSAAVFAGRDGRVAARTDSTAWVNGGADVIVRSTARRR